jgi:hypothetical protein
VQGQSLVGPSDIDNTAATGSALGFSQRELDWRAQRQQDLENRLRAQQSDDRRRAEQALAQRQREQLDQQRSRSVARNRHPCARYWGKGYSTDYIQQRVGHKPDGPAITWPGNTQASAVRVGDVALFRDERFGHAAYVEALIWEAPAPMPSHLRISEMNWGPPQAGPEAEQCNLTIGYAIREERIVPLSAIDRLWRP